MEFAMDVKLDMNYDQRKQRTSGCKTFHYHQQQSGVQLQRHHLVYGEDHAPAAVDGIFVGHTIASGWICATVESSTRLPLRAASEFLTFSTTNNVAVCWTYMPLLKLSMGRVQTTYLYLYAEDWGGGKFVNRSDCFITIHRKVQADHDIKKLSEFLSVRSERSKLVSITPIDRRTSLRWLSARALSGGSTGSLCLSLKFSTLHALQYS